MDKAQESMRFQYVHGKVGAWIHSLWAPMYIIQ